MRKSVDIVIKLDRKNEDDKENNTSKKLQE